MIPKDKKIQATIKFKFNNGTFVANKEISSSLGQRRIQSDEFFDVLSQKMDLLPLKEGVFFTVFLLFINNHSYLMRVKLPSCNTLIKTALNVQMNIKQPGSFLNFSHFDLKNPYIITPYMLFEIVNYKYNCMNYRNISLRSYFKTHLFSLRSNGICIYIC